MKPIPGVLVVERLLSPAVCKKLRGIYDRYEQLGSQKDYSFNSVVHLFDVQKNGRAEEYEFMLHHVVTVRDLVRKKMGLEGPLYIEAAFLAMLPEGGRHPIHRDNCTDDGRPNHTPQRDYSSLTYLNGDFEGGKIIFQARGEVQPKTGMLVAFPSGRDFPHEVPAVTKGRRYSMPVWFTLSARSNMFGGGR